MKILSLLAKRNKKKQIMKHGKDWKVTLIVKPLRKVTFLYDNV